MPPAKNLGVNVQDVIEHLQERIRYYTSGNNYSSDAGASVGQAYNTSAYRKRITKVEVDFDPLVGADSFLVRLDELESNNEIKEKLFTSNTRSGPFGAGSGVRSFTFHDANGDPGVVIEKSIRLGILLSRLGDDSDSAVAAVHGSEASNSPNETYDDASTDFELVNGIVYNHINPGVGASTHSHDTQIRGNIKIFYELILDHGNLVGDGTVNAAHINSGTATDGEVLTADGSGGADWEAASGGGGGALTQATETTLGGVRGATALQAIAANGTAILAWTNNRLRQLLAVALPTMVQADIDGSTTGRKAVTGELIAANAGGGGTDDQTAAEVSVDTTNFSRNLTATDDSVQAALETIDGFTQYQGTWQQASWPAGVIVTRSGIAYISLVNNNTQIPTPASTQWAGLTEGFTYRGEAPVLATNYNYGHVVKNPTTGAYYYFTSTISASVARADIATHANFLAIAGETGHSPRVGSGNAFPTTPAPLASDIFFFNVDVASGLDWKDTDGTTDLTAATGGDMAFFDGTDWIKVINLVGGGGAADPDRVVLANAVAVSNTAGPHEIALTEAMKPRQWLSLFALTSATASPDGIGYVLSDDVLALLPEATAPTDAENALPVVMASYSASNFTQQSGNVFVYRKDDSTLWVRPTRLAAHTLTITATPMGGGGASTSEQAASSGSGPRERDIVGTNIPLNAANANTAWNGQGSGTFTFPATPRDEMERIEFSIDVDSHYSVPFVLLRHQLEVIGGGALGTPTDGATRIQCAFWAGRATTSSRNRGIVIHEPRLDFCNERRNANDICLMVHPQFNSDQDWTGITIRVRAPSTSGHQFVYGKVYDWGS